LQSYNRRAVYIKSLEVAFELFSRLSMQDLDSLVDGIVSVAISLVSRDTGKNATSLKRVNSSPPQQNKIKRLKFVSESSTRLPRRAKADWER
jgi:hypothetical protein